MTFQPQLPMPTEGHLVAPRRPLHAAAPALAASPPADRIDEQGHLLVQRQHRSTTSTAWKLDQRTRAAGRAGIIAARLALAASRPPAPPGDTVQGSSGLTSPERRSHAA